MNQPRMPSPAILVTALALVAAVAGTAVAGPGASTSKITKKKVQKIAKKQINKLAPGLSVLNADRLDNLDATDFRRSNDVIGATDLGPITERSSAPTTVGPGSFGSAGHQCNAGEKVLSGGNDFAVFDPTTSIAVVGSQFDPPNGWRVFLRNNSASGNATVTALVYCLAP